ncbi:CHAD domain protein [Leptolyngbya sp. O-77]|nr:CHAD domain protein [Leptolyngbya sp. O-77]
MKTEQRSKGKQSQKSQHSHQTLQLLTLGEYAHCIVGEQYRQMVKHEKHVLADTDPEHLHQMRVHSRRLYTALQVFAAAIVLPRAAHAKHVRSLTKALGKLRDLDVQIATLQTDYHPHLSQPEQAYLERAIAALQQKRCKTLAGTRDILSQSRYRDLKTAYETWLSAPQFTSLAQVPIMTVLPDLLSPLLSTSLLHPGWLIATEEVTEDTAPTLHDLRKACKHVRYQAEFFISFYGTQFKAWIAGLKSLQDSLGRLQDIQVLLELLSDVLPKGIELSELRHMVQSNQQKILANWNQTRLQQLDPASRYQLYEMLLQPVGE